MLALHHFSTEANNFIETTLPYLSFFFGSSAMFTVPCMYSTYETSGSNVAVLRKTNLSLSYLFLVIPKKLGSLGKSF